MGSFSSRLILSFFVLIVLTTVGAGIPAYLLAREQAERQAWSQVDGARSLTVPGVFWGRKSGGLYARFLSFAAAFAVKRLKLLPV